MPTIPSTFDEQIAAAARQYLPEIDWRLLKAQYFQESRLDPQARSPAGAMGIAQFMPATWRETCGMLQYPPEASAYDPVYAIPGGAHYMRRMRRLWSKPEVQSPEERHRFALASYNAGGGNIQRAWRLAGKPGHWWAVEPYLPEVTGRHADETITYVARVYRWFEQLKREAA